MVGTSLTGVNALHLIFTLLCAAPIAALLVWAIWESRLDAKVLAQRPHAPAVAKGVRDAGYGFWPRIDSQARAESAAKMSGLLIFMLFGLPLVGLLAAALTALAALPLAFVLEWTSLDGGLALGSTMLEAIPLLIPSPETATMWGGALSASALALFGAMRVRSGRLATAPVWAAISAALVLNAMSAPVQSVLTGSSKAWTAIFPLLCVGALMLALLISSLRGWLWLRRNGVPMRF